MTSNTWSKHYVKAVPKSTYTCTQLNFSIQFCGHSNEKADTPLEMHKISL